jgi:hypothetical protein
VSEVQADARTKANQTLAEMRKNRDDFRDTVKKQAQANEAVWIKEKARLESSGKRSHKSLETMIFQSPLVAQRSESLALAGTSIDARRQREAAMPPRGFLEVDISQFLTGP